MIQNQKPEAMEKIEEESVPKKVSATGKEITLLILFIVFVGLIAVYFISRDQGTQNQGREEARVVQPNDPAPDFSLKSLDGKTVKLSDLRGKVVLVHFWATWCPACIEEMPTLQALSNKFTGTNLTILAISVDEGGADIVSSFMHRNKLSLTTLLDSNQSVTSRYGTFKFPETYVIDRTGVVRYKAIGAYDWTQPDNVRALNSLLAER